MSSQIISLTNTTSNLRPKVVYTGNDLQNQVSEGLNRQFEIHYTANLDTLNQYLSEQSLLSLPEIIVIEIDKQEKCFTYIQTLKRNPLLQGLIIVLISTEKNNAWKARALQLKVHDYYTYPFPSENLCERLNFLVKFKLIKPRLTQLSEQVNVEYKMPWTKRTFDILSSGTALLLLSPLFLAVSIIVRLGSKGPIIYKSKRVGTGYKIFDFYKFRSMRPGSDKEMEELAKDNQYAAENGKSAFIKIKNDPRITKVGHFIRNTSIDELPQLFNVLIGDMSLVGNRPLPLYEAEMLTSNEWSSRFSGPAGLTGLWQISKRGKEDMSERERKKLDNFYANKYSFWLDMKIIFGTIPALLQKEKV